MITLIDKTTREAVAVVFSTNGYDMSLYDIAGPPPENTGWIWDVPTETWIVRPPNEREQTALALDADTRWQAMKTASPQQVETWLSNNVTDLASARAVLKILVLAIQNLARTR